MRLFRKRRARRPLSERECYARLHGERGDDVRLLAAAPPPPPLGPTDAVPAPHLAFRYPRGGVTVSGEELRRELARRLDSRGDAARKTSHRSTD